MSNQNQIDRLATINDAIKADDATGFLVRYFNLKEKDARATIARELAKMTTQAASLDSAVSISAISTAWIADLSATAMLAWGIVDALAIREIPLGVVQANMTKSVLVLSRIQIRTDAENLDLSAKGEALYQIDQAIQQAAYNATKRQ